MISMEMAEAIAKRVNKKLSDWEIPISVRPGYIVMVSLVVRELREEARRTQKNQPATGISPVESE